MNPLNPRLFCTKVGENKPSCCAVVEKIQKGYKQTDDRRLKKRNSAFNSGKLTRAGLQTLKSFQVKTDCAKIY